jgi:hypothetical protein
MIDSGDRRDVRNVKSIRHEKLVPNIPAACLEISRVGLQNFCKRYSIDRRSDSGLVSLKYDSARSPMQVQSVQDCRGLILYEDDPTFPVCMPFRKFFNLGEPNAAVVDWGTARALNKMDGSLMMLYFDHRLGDWRVGTSGHPTAGGSYGAATKTFSDVFWQMAYDSDMVRPDKPFHLMDDIWYFFELCSPDNRIVVKYDRPQLVLIGARRRAGLLELSVDELVQHAVAYRWSVVQSDESVAGRPLKYLIRELASCTDPMALEGFVVVDASFNRVKVKNPRYVEIHHLRGSRSPRAVIELWKAGEVEEVLAHFPELSDQFASVLDVVLENVQTLSSVWHNIRNEPTRKEFAALAKRLPFSNVLFDMYSNKDAVGDDPPAHIIRKIRDGMTTPAILRNIKKEPTE